MTPTERRNLRKRHKILQVKIAKLRSELERVRAVRNGGAETDISVPPVMGEKVFHCDDEHRRYMILAFDKPTWRKVEALAAASESVPSHYVADIIAAEIAKRGGLVLGARRDLEAGERERRYVA